MKLFQNLRNKYSRDKKKVTTKKVSGAGTDEVKQAVKETSELYPFLKWLEPYIQPRKTVSNYIDVDAAVEDEEDSEMEIKENDQPSTSRYCRDGKI